MDLGILEKSGCSGSESASFGSGCGLGWSKSGSRWSRSGSGCSESGSGWFGVALGSGMDALGVDGNLFPTLRNAGKSRIRGVL